MGNRASPLVRCDYPSHTSAVYSHSCIPTVRSCTQYNRRSILQMFPNTRCSHTGTTAAELYPLTLTMGKEVIGFSDPTLLLPIQQHRGSSVLILSHVVLADQIACELGIIALAFVHELIT
jgi:hypothetical protein